MLIVETDLGSTGHKDDMEFRYAKASCYLAMY